MNINPEVIYKRLDEVGQQWVKAQAEADLLEENKKIELAILTHAELDSGVKSISQAEINAKCRQEYRTAIEQAAIAREKANAAKVKYASAQAWFEALRSQAATLRQELKTNEHRT